MDTDHLGPAGETFDSPRHRALGSESRVEIMRLIRAAEGGLTAGEVSAQTGQHLSTTRTHLDRLARAGLLVKARSSGGQPGRPAWRYRAAAQERTPAPAPYRVLAAALLDHLGQGRRDVRAAAARVGEDWGRRLAAHAPPTGRPTERPVDRVLSVLAALGFDPVMTDPPGPEHLEIQLRTCPFLELVSRNPDAMCGLHLGVIRGALAEAGVRPTGATLEPFGAPTACVARVPAAAAGTPDPTPPTRPTRPVP